jgi:arylsulfatase
VNVPTPDRLARLLLHSAFALSIASAAHSRPNVLLILADDLGYSDLGCYGGEIPPPALDSLADGGLRFTACYNSARCCPTRAALMTGLHPHEAGIGSFATAKPAGDNPAYTGHLLADNITLAELLKSAGYSTWMVGKWHMGTPGPIERGFDHYYGYRSFLSWAEDQWDPSRNIRLPEGTEPEIKTRKPDYYATDIFTDYTLEFFRQARQTPAKPWFVFLSHSSPHFPIQAPKASIDRHFESYLKGWDHLRAERIERMKKLGIIPADTPVPPLSMVPKDTPAISNGYSEKPNPEWSSLPEDRRRDLARRMATYAAMVEHMDQGIARIIADLKQAGEFENTLILFTSDNGACYEWGPYGFDKGTRRGINILHADAALAGMGQDGTDSSYGSAWANLCNTPFNKYKHFCHEGGIRSPLIAHWPKGISAPPGSWVEQPSHVIDFLPTIAAAADIPIPQNRGETKLRPVSGISLMPALKGKPLPQRNIYAEHQTARGIRSGDWKLVMGKVRGPKLPPWELYNLAKDPSEQINLADELPEKVSELKSQWETWADHVGVNYRKK